MQFIQSKFHPCRIGFVVSLVLILAGFSAGFALSDQQLEDLVQRYSSVNSAINNRSYGRAAQVLTDLITDYNRSEFADELQFVLAECYLNAGEYEEARKVFQRLADRPRLPYLQPEAQYGLALSQVMLGYYGDADYAVQRMAKARGYTDDPRAYFVMGLVRYLTGDYNAAVAMLRSDSLPEAQYYLGKALSRQGKPREALLAFKKVTSIMPPTPVVPLAHFAAGEALFANADFAGALVKFRFFLESYPTSPLADYAHFFIGCALVYDGKYDDGARELASLTNHKNGFLAAHANYYIGYCNLMTGRPQEASTRFQRVRSYYPYTKVTPYANLRLTQALMALGDTFQTMVSTNQLSTMFTAGELRSVGNYLSGVLTLQLGQYERSANYFENVIVKNPQSSLREPAVALMLQGLNAGTNYRRAVSFGAKYIRDYPAATKQPTDVLNPWRPKILYYLGEAYYYQEQYAQAEEAYRRAYSSPGNDDVVNQALLGRSYCLVHLDRPEEAIPGFRQLLREGTKDTSFTVSALMGLSFAFFNRRDFDSARAGFEYVTERYPNRIDILPNAFFYLGMCYRKLGYAGDAVDAWGTIVNRYANNPKAAEAAFRGGETWFKAGDYAKAVDLFRFVTDRYPFSIYGPSSQAFLGTCYYNLGKFPDAIREHHKYLDLYPNDPQAPSVRKTLEMEYYRVVQYDPSYMPAFIQRYPESDLAAQLRFDRALTLMRAENFDSAAREFQLIVVNHPNSSLAPKAQLSTGECFASTSNWQLAADAYNKYLGYYPTGTDRDAALFNLGVSYFRLAEYQKALTSFQTLISTFPNSQYAVNARSNIEVTKRRLSAPPPPSSEPVPATPPPSQPVPQPSGGGK